jgi:hypothetical protein
MLLDRVGHVLGASPRHRLASAVAAVVVPVAALDLALSRTRYEMNCCCCFCHYLLWCQPAASSGFSGGGGGGSGSGAGFGAQSYLVRNELLLLLLECVGHGFCFGASLLQLVALAAAAAEVLVVALDQALTRTKYEMNCCCSCWIVTYRIVCAKWACGNVRERLLWCRRGHQCVHRSCARASVVMLCSVLSRMH